MASKKTPPTDAADQTIAPELVETITTAQNTMAVLQSAHSDERDTLNQMMGQIQMTGAIAKLTTVIGLTKLAQIKETRMYKAFAGKKGIDVEGNEIADIGTWEGFCLAVGTTRQKVDEDIMNLKAFGETALADLSRVGAGYRELRQYRKLPEDEKNALIEVARSGDKEALVEFAETIFEKHTKEKTELTKKVSDLTADIDAKDAVAESNQKRINELQEKVARIKKLPVDERDAELREEISSLLTTIDHELRVNFYNAIETLREHSGSDHSEFIDAQLQMLDDTVQFLRNDLSDAEPEWQE